MNNYDNLDEIEIYIIHALRGLMLLGGVVLLVCQAIR